ncbi:hypothetical protein TNCV_4558501 [Trichonephila clavipes]|nr:hypothetical protein TNCV_4558501 [Trichonephila clavipes]
MVSPADQGQVPHPLIVPEFLRSTSRGMTSARGQGAIVNCLHSGSGERQTGRHNSKGFVKGILETGGVMVKCVQMWTRNYGALGQTARVCLGVLCANRTREVKRYFGDLPIRRSGGVVNTRLVFNRVLFEEKGKEEKKKKNKRVRERERTEGGGETEKRERRLKESRRERE